MVAPAMPAVLVDRGQVGLSFTMPTAATTMRPDNNRPPRAHSLGAPTRFSAVCGILALALEVRRLTPKLRSMWAAVFARVKGRDRRCDHRHAIPIPERRKRMWIRNQSSRGRHARDHRRHVLQASGARSYPYLAKVQQGVTRLLHSPPAADLGVALVAARAWLLRLSVHGPRVRAFGVVLITCLIGAGAISAALSLGPPDRPSLRGTSLTPRPPSGIAGSPGSRLTAGKPSPSVGAAPETGTAPSHEDLQPQSSAGPRHDPSLEAQALPPAPGDPDLEAALDALDNQADRDQSIWQQQELGQPPTTAGPPAVLPDGQAPIPPQQPSTTTPASPRPAAPDEGSTSGRSDQQASSVPDAS